MPRGTFTKEERLRRKQQIEQLKAVGKIKHPLQQLADVNKEVWNNNKEEIIYIYKSGKSLRQVAKQFGFKSKTFIQRKLAELDLLRDNTMALSETQRRRMLSDANPMNNPESRRKVSEQNATRDWNDVIRKRINTNIEKYGTEHATQSSEVQQKRIKTCIDKYGETHPMKNEIVFKKVFENAKYNPVYTPKGIRMRSRLETHHAYLLDNDSNVSSWQYEPMVLKTGAGNYHPDFLVIYKDGSKEIHEIKSDFTLNKKPETQVKLKEARTLLKAMGFSHKLFVYEKKGKRYEQTSITT